MLGTLASGTDNVAGTRSQGRDRRVASPETLPPTASLSVKARSFTPRRGTP
jgi:hypothetical protein